jgi:hypothetical protein
VVGERRREFTQIFIQKSEKWRENKQVVRRNKKP